MTNNNERHAVLIEAGWRVGADGRWRSPDPADPGRYTFDGAWDALTETTDPDAA